jgi:Zn-dependent M16 (insulinase) family peptidase
MARYFLNNSHRLTFTMIPSEEYSSNLIKVEQTLLSNLLSKVDNVDKLYERNLRLLEAQDEKQGRSVNPDLECLPFLSLSELSSTPQFFPVSSQTLSAKNGCFDVTWRHTETNNLSYFYLEWEWNVSQFDRGFVPWLQLFSDAFASLGTLNKSFAQFNEEIRSLTGGIGVSTKIINSKNDTNDGKIKVTVSSHCMDEKIPEMYRLIGELVTSVNWKSLEDLQTSLDALSLNLGSSVADSGHFYAMKLSGGRLSFVERLKDELGGIGQISFLEDIRKQPISFVSDNLAVFCD